MRKKPVLQKKPSAFLWWTIGIFFKFFCLIRYNLKIKGVKPKGPAIILSNHTSDPDFHFIISACFPNRINFLCSSFFFTFKKYAFWLNKVGVIPKLQFSTDIVCLKKMKYVVDQNKGMVFIAPEGTVYANGKLGPISPAIAKMIQFFNVDVYTCKIQGAGLGMAKWSKNRHDAHVQIETKLAITKEECKSLSREEIMNRITSDLEYNEFEYQAKNNIRTKGKTLAEGFENRYFKCPVCGSEFTLKTHGNIIECTHCHAQAEILDTFRFKWHNTDKQYFDNYIEWYDWQLNDLKKQIKKPNFKLEEDVAYGTTIPGKEKYVKVGKGHMVLDRTGWTYKGTYKRKRIEEHDELGSVYLAILRDGVHFELPFRDEHARVYFPKNGATAGKWHLASRAITELLAEGAL